MLAVTTGIVVPEPSTVTLCGLGIGLVVAVVYWIILGLVASAASSILIAALYRSATTGKVAEDFQGLPMFGTAPPRPGYGTPP